MTDLEKLFSEAKVLAVPITSDRGLCGGVNGAIMRPMRRIGAGKDVSFVLVGDRARSALSRPLGPQTIEAFTGTSKVIPPPFITASAIAQTVAATPKESAVFGWNYFKNAMSYETRVTKLPKLEAVLADTSGIQEYEIEGNAEETIQNLYEYSYAMFMYYFLVETGVVEQSQRMIAMESSTKNATELIDKLRLLYNRTRQSRITTELVEIISGAAALDD
jgi:F-type H+-transporting ATPase subunit gamma